MLFLNKIFPKMDFFFGQKILKVFFLQPMAESKIVHGESQFYGPCGSTSQTPIGPPPINFQLCYHTFVPMNKAENVGR